VGGKEITDYLESGGIGPDEPVAAFDRFPCRSCGRAVFRGGGRWQSRTIDSALFALEYQARGPHRPHAVSSVMARRFHKAGGAQGR
jgi:hypothetical protein